MIKTKTELVNELRTSFQELCSLCNDVHADVFNQSLGGKWTPAENFQHLVTATKITAVAFRLPKFIHQLLYGKPRRTSHGYSKVIEKYQKKLKEGAAASGVYVPKKTDYNQQQILRRLKAEAETLVSNLENNWTDEQLDSYQVAHPILGLLTLRELAYFTIYHNAHHIDTVKKVYMR